MRTCRSALVAALAGIIATAGLLTADVAEARRHHNGHAKHQAVKRAYIAGAVQQHRREQWREEIRDARDRERRRETRAVVGAVVGAAVVGTLISNSRD